MERARRLSFHLICLALIVVSVCAAIFVFPEAWARLLLSFRDFGSSFAGFTETLFTGKRTTPPTITNPFPVPELPPDLPAVIIPDTSEGFSLSWAEYWARWASSGNFAGYLSFTASLLYTAVTYALVVIPPVFIIFKFLSMRGDKVDNNYNRDSLPLKVLHRAERYAVFPVFRYVRDFFRFCFGQKYEDGSDISLGKRRYVVPFFLVWAYNLNLFSVAISAAAYYFYFSVSVDFGSLYLQVYKLFVDLTPVFVYVPWYLLTFFFARAFFAARRSLAYAGLYAREGANRDFIKSLKSLCIMFVGTMGKGKTTLLTDIAISKQNMFREKALEILLKEQLKFPDFPWINLKSRSNAR